MIKVHFFDWESSTLDIERELCIDVGADEFLMQHIRGICLDSTGDVADMENNTIYWFAAADEASKAREIAGFLSSAIPPGSRMGFAVTTEAD